MCSPRPFRWCFGSSGPPVPDTAVALDREEALTLYRIAVDEYRFQVTLNWNRTQYTLALNIGVLGVGVGLSGVAEASPWMVASIFVVGRPAAWWPSCSGRSSTATTGRRVIAWLRSASSWTSETVRSSRRPGWGADVAGSAG